MGQTCLDDHIHRDIFFLIGCSYDGKVGKAYLKLLNAETQEVKIIYDESGHKPYCYVKEPLENVKEMKLPGVVDLVRENKYDLLRDQAVEVIRIIASDPLAIGGSSNSIREKIKAWEADIPYHLCYLYDMQLTPCAPYCLVDGKLVEAAPSEEEIKRKVEAVFGDLSGEEKKLLTYWVSLLEAAQPRFKYLSLDIEVLSPVSTRVPSPTKARDKVVAAALIGSDGRREVYLLKTPGFKEPKCDQFEAKIYEDESQMLREIFRVIDSYPVVATFNGDDFDMPYLRHRGEVLNIPREQIPISLGREGASLKHGIHIDLYKLFMNRSIQVYAFDNRYREHTLGAIAQALLGKGKIEIEKPIGELTTEELARYCFQDALLVHELLTSDNELLLKLLVVLSRISKMPIEDACRHGVSGWIKSLLYFEHRKRGCLIPRSDELIEEKGVISTKAVIEGKKYRGAIVVDPVPGVHFTVTVLDFSSLYPSVLKEWNLSYETARCPHQECRNNVVPETTHWICRKRRGIQSEVIGCLRDIRVRWYKPKSSDPNVPEAQRRWYSVVQRALKVFLNAAYGVFGFEEFPLYCPPVAESTAAIARYAFKKTVEKASELGIEVLYGDTDSLFLKTTNEHVINELVAWVKKELNLDLEIDKRYRYIVFSQRKKNYLGVTDKGVVDVKGLTGKKSHIPSFIKDAFEEMLKILGEVKSEGEFEEAKMKIAEILKSKYYTLKKGEYNLEDLSFKVMLSKGVDKYVKTTPPHVKAARKLINKGIQVVPGDIIAYVKTKDSDGVEPLELARKDQVDVDKYIEYLMSTFEQVLDALGIDFDRIVGITSLEYFM
ncbi:MAG: DNA-directed DNA polymerase I [Nitrososphaeria archaeon]|nr:DNA-directed DNA polymerase I [Nitrososphaeria archaeon]